MYSRIVILCSGGLIFAYISVLWFCGQLVILCIFPKSYWWFGFFFFFLCISFSRYFVFSRKSNPRDYFYLPKLFYQITLRRLDVFGCRKKHNILCWRKQWFDRLSKVNHQNTLMVGTGTDEHMSVMVKINYDDIL